MTFVTVKPAIRRRPTLNIDRWLDELMKPVADAPVRPRTHGMGYPPVNVVEDGQAFYIQLAVPGLNKEDVEIKVEKDVLSISGKREDERLEGETFRRREFGAYAFDRRFQLPETVDAGAITAAYFNGVLTVTVPKQEEVREKPARKIEIA